LRLNSVSGEPLQKCRLPIEPQQASAGGLHISYWKHESILFVAKLAFEPQARKGGEDWNDAMDKSFAW